MTTSLSHTVCITRGHSELFSCSAELAGAGSVRRTVGPTVAERELSFYDHNQRLDYRCSQNHPPSVRHDGLPHTQRARPANTVLDTLPHNCQKGTIQYDGPFTFRLSSATSHQIRHSRPTNRMRATGVASGEGMRVNDFYRRGKVKRSDKCCRHWHQHADMHHIASFQQKTPNFPVPDPSQYRGDTLPKPLSWLSPVLPS